MSSHADEMEADPLAFWEERYKTGARQSSGRPGQALVHFTADLNPGRALELGCGRGDDAVHLAKAGWSVLAVELSQTALDIAAETAAAAGVANRIRFEQHDLTANFPEGMFDLIVASFLAATPRAPVFQRAAASIAQGGHLLIIDHGSLAPWLSSRTFPTVTETFEELDLPQTDWDTVYVDIFEREAKGPEGQTATIFDNVILLRRK